MGRVEIKRNRLLERLRELGATQKTVAVGVIGARADEQHQKDEATVAEVATWNHFGTDTIPARPFLTIALERHKAEIAHIQKRLARGLVEGKLELDQALGLLGETVVNAVKQTIADGVSPPNSQRTIERKGSATPLIDTGQLRGSISYVIREANPDGS